jgi:diguanylate cyclase (GGDEF)-like protein
MYRELAGEPAAALRLLRRAEELARDLDAPVLGYEIARVRARALRRLGHDAEARRQAALAGMIAAEHGWEHRARWIRAEFGTGEHARAGLASGPFASTVIQERTMRRMDALQQVGLAAATVFDPHQLARVALDETIRVFGAERAFLFLIDEERNRLVPHIGRDDAGQDIDAFTGYGATLVERVRDGADALVVTGDEDSWSVPSESAVVHGLRSIMVAPLRLKDRLLGVVYLDSRVARGIFTDDDVDVLVAITNHVAVSLETARAAQLEVAVRAARQQRDLAETLRSAMSEISSTLDPDEVLDRLLTAAHRALGADAACVLRHDGLLLTVAAVAGAAPLAAIGRHVDPDADAALATAITNPAPHRGGAAAGERCEPHDDGARAGLLLAPAPLPDVLPGTRSWVAVPLSTRDGIVGYVLATSGDPDRYTDAHVDIVATLAGQAAAAYDNAVLFDRVRQLATEDVLTGVYTRRHALELAGRDFADAVAAGAPLAAIMVDMDHFKAINDTHGHLVGDQVIAEVAARLRAVVRPDDLLGRYGGEEFVLVLAASRATVDEVAEGLRTVVNSTPVSTDAGRIPATVSVGIAYLRATDRDLSTLLGRADQALYAAKEQGRNRVAVSA